MNRTPISSAARRLARPERLRFTVPVVVVLLACGLVAAFSLLSSSGETASADAGGTTTGAKVRVEVLPQPTAAAETTDVPPTYPQSANPSDRATYPPRANRGGDRNGSTDRTTVPPQGDNWFWPQDPQGSNGATDPRPEESSGSDDDSSASPGQNPSREPDANTSASPSPTRNMSQTSRPSSGAASLESISSASSWPATPASSNTSSVYGG